MIDVLVGLLAVSVVLNIFQLMFWLEKNKDYKRYKDYNLVFSNKLNEANTKLNEANTKWLDELDKKCKIEDELYKMKEADKLYEIWDNEYLQS